MIIQTRKNVSELPPTGFAGAAHAIMRSGAFGGLTTYTYKYPVHGQLVCIVRATVQAASVNSRCAIIAEIHHWHAGRLALVVN